MRQTRPRIFTAVLAAVLVSALGMTPTSAGEPPEDPPADTTTSADDGENGSTHHTVTLITGDVVRYTPATHGAPLVDIDPAPRADGREVAFHSYPTGDGFVVLPDDAAGMVASGQLDRDLFDLPTLIEERAGDAGREIPLLVEHAESADPAPRAQDGRALPGAAVRTLRSIDAAAVELPAIQAAEYWATLTAADDVARTSAAHAATPSASAPSARIWLDRTVSATLDGSTEQIGAPSAWDLGLDGTGVRVAVLDTGIDEGHPDFADRIVGTADFTDSGVTDRHGHGTHVAGTVLGDGSASDGRFTGVAPGADLLVGKVLDDSGSGSMSQIIAGMEWAVAEGADIVNLSLSAGGGPADGSDPLSRALDSLTETSGTLFVVAAGNAGAPRTVFSPGAATRALTVGAVDSEGVLAEFSSYGPRAGDAAVKPNVVAPGVAIGSARAAGTDGPEPIDPWYTRASGTSMAAPHVAGAAALIAQQHPDWGADEIRDTLASTAVANEDIWYAQGGGRLDVAAAVTSKVYASASVDFGLLPRAGGMRTERITFTNTGDERVTLDLSVEDFRGWSGAAGPAGAVNVGGRKVIVPAGGTRTVTVRVDPKRGDPGAYGGYLTAESADGDVRLTVPFSYYTGTSTLIDITARSFDGGSENRLGTWVVLAVSTDGPASPEDPFDIGSTVIPLDPAGRGAVHLAEGEYQLIGLLSDIRRGRNDVVLERLSVSSPQSVVLDASANVTAAPQVPEPVDVRGQQSMLLVDTADDDEPFWVRSTSSNWPAGIAVTPQTGGEVRFMSQTHADSAAVTEMRTSDGELHRPTYDVNSTRRLIGDGVTMDVVSVGAGDPADYAGLDVAGKAVVIAVPVAADGDFPVFDAYFDLYPRAGMAMGMGAAAVVAYLDHAGDPGGYVWNFGPIPVLGLPAADGGQLATAAAAGPIELTIEGNGEVDATYSLRSDLAAAIPDTPPEFGYDELVEVKAHYHADTPGTSVRDTWGSVTTDGFETLAPSAGTFTGPVQRTEYIGSTRDDVTWLRQVEQGPLALRSLRTYGAEDQGATRDEHWFKAPLVPGAMTLQAATTLPPGFPVPPPWLPSDPPCALCRDGDRLVPALSWLDSDHHAGDLDPQVELFRNGTAIPVADGEPVSFIVPDDTADYRLVATDSPAGRPMPELVTTVTEFTSAPPSGRPDGFACTFGDSCEFVPAPQLRYDLPLDLLNRAEAGAEFTFQVAGHTAAGEPVETLSAQYSTDGGTSWADAVVSTVDDGWFGVVVDHPSVDDGDGYVALRVSATDAAGGTVEQTILRAYALR